MGTDAATDAAGSSSDGVTPNGSRPLRHETGGHQRQRAGGRSRSPSSRSRAGTADAGSKGGGGGGRIIKRSPKAKVPVGSTFTFQRPTTLLSARVWDVISPPPVNSVKGHFIPTPLAKYHRHRRISVEVHRVMPAVDVSEAKEDEKKDDDAAAKQQPAAADNKRGGLLSRAAESVRSMSGGGAGAKAGDDDGSFEECYIRILVPATSREARAARSAAKTATRGAMRVVDAAGKSLHLNLGGGTGGAATILSDDDSVVSLLADDDSTADFATPTASTAVGRQGGGDVAQHLEGIPEDRSMRTGTGTTNGIQVAPPPGPATEWLEKYRFALRDVKVNKRVSNSCVLTTSLGPLEQTREIIFDTDREAVAFNNLIEEHTKLEEVRSKKRLKSALGGISIKDMREVVDLLIEVVSGSDLPTADLLSSDPMVRVLFRGRQIHKTKFISKNLNPVWTIKTHSMCLFSVPAEELFANHEGLTFLVQDYDQFGGDEDLGAVMIPPKDLYVAKGERVEYKLKPLFGQKNYGTGKLAVRVRRATDHDKQFMEQWKKEQKNFNRAPPKKDLAATSKGGAGTIKSVMTRNERVEKSGPDEGKTKYRIRPDPDPKRVPETEWMTKEALQEESLKESRHWLDVGSGKLGRVFVEVIGCDGLPQLDTGGMFGNKTDAFVNIVFEDCIAKTDVISDTLSPRWMPWSQRAFVLNMMHSSSQLFLGVYDYDEGMFDDHDLIGRVSVDLSNFYPDTVYLLQYHIYPTAKTSYMREAKGTITFRLRIEYFDQRQLVLSNLEPPPAIHVNVKNRKDFRCVRYTTSGRVNMEVYSQKTITSYIEEIMTYMEAYYYIEDALVNVLMWRGHFPVPIRIPCKARSVDEDGNEIGGMLDRYTKRHTLRLPLHSMNAFLGTVFLVEKPTLIPSFCCAWTAWLLIAVMGYRRNNPNPWDRCKSFGEILQMVVLGKTASGPQTIGAYENAEAAKAFTEKWQKRMEEAEKQAEKRRLQAIKDQEEWQREMEEIGDINTDISTKVGGGPSIDPLKPILFPIQQWLGVICNCLRFTKNVIIWEECYFAFLVSAASLVLAIAFAFVPWAFMIRWSSRLIVWSLFGPWMKLVDIFWYSKAPLSEEELKEHEAKAKREKAERTKALALEARIAREDAAKLKDMKVYMFGSFITKVNLLKLDRFEDNPLPASTATPYKPKALPMSELAMQEAGRNRTRVPGQHLVGDMIPVLEVQEIKEAPTGQPTAKPGLLDKESPGATVGKDSDVNAATKLGGIVVAAAVLTWFGVPIMISTVKYIFSR